VPWSAGNYYLSGPTYIIYNNYGTLDSTSMFDTPYRLFNGVTHKEVLVDWKIDYYIKDKLTNKWWLIDDTSAPEKIASAWKFYEGYMPKLDVEGTGTLVPSSLYLEDLECIPVVVAYSGFTNYWR
jgi:hypothetical protein